VARAAQTRRQVNLDAAERVGPNIAQEHDGEASANWRRFGLQFAAEQLNDPNLH
jgi:hypothetical protein